MDKNRLFYLIDQVNKGAATPDEIAEYDACLNRLTAGQKAWDAEGLGEEAQTREELRAMLAAQITKQPVRRIQLWPRIAAAACLLIGLSFGGYFLLHKTPNPQTAQLVKNDIAPGHNQATLTLANGQKIILTKGLSGKLARQGNTSVTVNSGNAIAYTMGSPSDEVLYNTLSTARGEQSPYPLVLADGTKVWLNAESSVTYPTAFNGKERIVKVTGEAYFEVVHNDKMPFKVTVNGQTVEDIGTHFNINAYADEPAIKTTLLEGSVKITGEGQLVILKPGQAAALKDNRFKVTDADAGSAVAWKNGLFRFDNTSVQSLMRQLARWYDIEVAYQGTVTGHEFAGEIRRNTNLSNVLKILEQGGIHFRMDGRKLIVTP